mgnify:CR=1 FL=1|jgi:Predicted transcriptional regulators
MKLISLAPKPDDEALARRLAALAHPVRIELLRRLGESDACCVKELVGRVGLAQSTVSQHLKVLLEAGLVTYRPDRQSSRYRLDRSALAAVAGSMAEIVSQFCGPACCGPAIEPGVETDASRAAWRQPDRTS